MWARREEMRRNNIMSKRGLFNSYLNNLSFSKKFALLFVFSIMIPVLVQNIVYYHQTEQSVQAEMLEKLNDAMNDKAEKINNMLSGAVSLMKAYCNNETLYRYLDYTYDRELEYLIQYQEAFQLLFSDSMLYPYEISNMMIYTDNDTILNGAVVRTLNPIDKETLGEALSYVSLQPIEGKSRIYFRTAHEKSRFARTVDTRSISLLIIFDHYSQYSKYQKILRANLNTSYMERVLLESNLFENMFLVDSENHIISAANSYSNIGEMAVYNEQEQEKNEGYTVLKKELSDFHITLYGIYDDRAIAKEFSHSRLMSFAISILCLLFALCCVYLVVANMNRRLERLVKQSEEIAKGNFVLYKPEISGKDEFSVLEESINQMSQQLTELIDKEYKSRIIQAELEKETNQARFLALQSQVNPHFMFNALESIRLKAVVKGEKETAQMIRYMARMFRNLIEWRDNIITLREEMNFLDEFLHIQNYRFGDEFSYEINVAEEAWDCLIPKMILQPLVENACVHGVEAVSDNRWVKVDAVVCGEYLKLSIEDNGGGMTDEKLKELRAMLSGQPAAGKSVGLWNVYRRLNLYYGDTCSFEIDSVYGSGTKCQISIPIGNEKRDYDFTLNGE